MLSVNFGNYDRFEHPSGKAIQLDSEGRWCWFRNGPYFYRRALDGEVVYRQENRYLSCTHETALHIHQDVYTFLTEFLTECKNLPTEKVVSFQDNISTVFSQTVLQEHIENALRWRPQSYLQTNSLFSKVYAEQIPILPPDRCRDVVILPALGCPNGRCSFCHFYSDQPFRIFSEEMFSRHLEHLHDFFGKALLTREGFFLGSASALSIPQKKLLSFLEKIQDVFGSKKRGIAAFHDVDHSPKRTFSEWKNLYQMGLRQATIGLETGSPELRESLGKKRDLLPLLQKIEQQKNAGIQCAITVLVGIGNNFVEKHYQETCLQIQKMSLDTNDIVYLSPLDSVEQNQNLKEELHLFRQELHHFTKAKIVPYQVGLFRYFA